MRDPPDLFRLTSTVGGKAVTAVAVLLLAGMSCLVTPAASTPFSPQTSWTFNQPGVSHVSFSPPMSDSRMFRLEMSFRTLQPNGVLMYQEVAHPSEAAAAVAGTGPGIDDHQEVVRLMKSFQLFVELRQGHLRVGHIYDHYKDIVNIGRALNDDQWHKLSVSLNQTSGQLNVSLDSGPLTQYLKAYIWGNANDVLVWAKVLTTFQFGGVNGPHTANFRTFIGCLKDLRYTLKPRGALEAVPIAVTEGVTPGCLDQCHTSHNRCKHNGRCVNLYTDFHCDCSGTSYEGPTCDQPGPTLLTFSGYEWVTYRLYQGEENRPFSDHTTVSLEFKTEEPSGILLYAVGGSPYHNHITAALDSGRLHVSLAFGQQDLNFPLGNGLDDNRWHRLTIEHRGRQVTVTIDRQKSSKTVSHSDFFISLDPLVYFGGGDKFVVTRGLPVTRNYIGCMRNVYFNGHSVLYRLSSGDDDCTYHGGEKATFGCSPDKDVPLSFPNAASMLRWRLGSRGGNLSVDFSFRTVREDGILFYVELLSLREGGGSDYGLMEVWVRKGQPALMFVPSLRYEMFNENITIPATVNDQQWHSMNIRLEDSRAKLTVDGVTSSTQPYHRPLSHKGQVILGFGLRGYKQNEGYVGCLKSVVIQGQRVEPITVVDSNSAIGLILDGCHLVDHCSIKNICQHGSQCLSDWAGVQCDCVDDSYEGKACHFPHYPPTCDAYYQAGHLKSGVYLIDVDGSGPLDPSYVECSMGSQRNGQLYGATIVEHNFAQDMPVRGPYLEDRSYHLTYREMNRNQLLALGDASASCEQFFKFSCQHSPILLGEKTWFKAASGHVVDYLGSTTPGHCACSEDSSCHNHRCACDKDEGRQRSDEGYSHIKHQLPIMDLTFLQRRPSPGTANMTLGPFTCWGSGKQRVDNTVTFTTQHSHLKLQRWTGGSLGFQFKTHHHNALLLLHTSADPLFGNMMSIKIVSENSVEFYFRLNNTIVRERLRVPNSISEGDWHTILIEHDPYNVRLSVDTTRVLVSLDSALHGVLDYNGHLYLGGLPKEEADSYGERIPGMSGCVRAFLYNHQEVELSQLIDPNMRSVSSGCMSSCWPNPCQHGGTCVEDWGHYSCQCQDPWAHQGHNCEHNLNVDAVTFSGEESSYLTFDLSKISNPLDQTIVLSFRTFQSDALIFYAHDHLANFLQLELHQRNTVVFTYNSFHNIVSGSITAPEPLNNGQWHQVVAQEYYNLTKLIMGGQTNIIEFKHTKVHTYSVDPFKDSVQQETVFMARTFQPPGSFTRLYVGGLAEGGAASPFLKGCVRGMRVGNHHINLRQGVKNRGGKVSEVTPACDTGCKEDTCKNDGYCYEHWRYGNFTCDCSESDFSGIHCDKGASVMLDGSSVLQHSFMLPVSAQRSVTEQIFLTFKTSGPPAVDEHGDKLDMALFFVASSQYKDYILAKLDSEGNVLIETNQGVGIYRMKVSGNFANGMQHELVYKREGSDMFLTLDGVKEAKVVYPDYDLNSIDTIIVGGVLMDEENEFDHITNFTGCISNTVFIPEANLDLKLRTLKDYYMDSPDVTVLGGGGDGEADDHKLVSCSASQMTPVVTEPPLIGDVGSNGFSVLTMPPWVVGAADMVTLSPPLVLTTPPPPTTTTLSNGSVVMVAHAEGVVPSIWIIVIVVAILLVIFLVIVIIALVTYCKRRRQQRGYMVKKDADIELKQPLNSFQYWSPSPSVKPSPPPKMPKDHLARLDEFSMVSATLGPRPTAKPEENHVEPTPVNSNRNSVASMPKADPDFVFEHPIFNKRKQRPASSISEVLEELERRQNPKTNEPFIEPVASVPEKQEPEEVTPKAEKHPTLSFKAEDSSPSADESQGKPNSMLDGNADSGYEAESTRPDITEDDVTPTGEVEDDDFDDGDEDTAEAKPYFLNNMSGSSDVEDSPILSSPSKQRLLRRSTTPT